MENLSGEQRYEHVFGDTFALYTREEMKEFIRPFEVRFEQNGLNARDLFAGKRCLDAACGNGRGALFMLMNGAVSVTACDFSETNVASTRSFLQDFGFDAADVFQSSLERIERPTESFDFVWCNGVIMHTERPNLCLEEIARVLKVGGKSWIYVYGSGGIYWRTIQFFRGWLADISVHECIGALRLMRYETRYVAEFIDDWYATYLRSYTHEDFATALANVGFEQPAQPLPYGMPYDTSHRRNTLGSDERDLMGEGDLRYVLHKVRPTQQGVASLSEDEYGSRYPWPESRMRPIDEALERLRGAAVEPWQRIAAAAQIQRELRLQMTRPDPFDPAAYVAMIEKVERDALKCSSLRTVN